MTGTGADTGPIAGVVGMPVGQSLSPVIHGHWLRQFGLSGRYERREIAPDRFPSDMDRLLGADGWVGMNVTIPHKEAAFIYCHARDDAATRLKAVNTIVKRADGVIEGRNTDLNGFRANLEQAEGWRAVGRGPAVVLGAGGAARAVVAALRDLEFSEIRVVNRTVARAQALAADLPSDRPGAAPILVYDDSAAARALDGAAILVNTTSLGMQGQAPLDLDLSPLPRAAFVTDIVYKPLETRLLAKARARGHGTVDGLGMLLHQAVPGFIAWFQPPTPPRVDADLRRRVLEAMAG